MDRNCTLENNELQKRCIVQTQYLILHSFSNGWVGIVSYFASQTN